MSHFKNVFSICLLTVMLPLYSAYANEKVFEGPHHLKISVKEMTPDNHNADLQIIPLVRHTINGERYIQAMNYFNEQLGSLLSSLLENKEFLGELGETLLFIPPSDSASPKRVLLIGLGDESDLTLDKLKVAGRIAARSAVRLQAKQVSLAPTLRDQGSIEIGEDDAVIAEQVVLAYDTEKRLQSQKLAPQFDISEWIIEAAPSYFDNIAEKVDKAVHTAMSAVKSRSGTPLSDRIVNEKTTTDKKDSNKKS